MSMPLPAILVHFAVAVDTTPPLTISDIKVSCEDVAVTFKLNVRFSITIIECAESVNSVTDGGGGQLHSWWSSWR